MSLLHFHQRPWVIFDPGNEDHRRWFVRFQEETSWKSCPVRFFVPDHPGTDVATAIQKKLVQYYINNEFDPKKDAGTTKNRLFKLKVL